MVALFLTTVGVTLLLMGCGRPPDAPTSPGHVSNTSTAVGPSDKGASNSYRYTTSETWEIHIQVLPPQATQQPGLNRTQAWQAFLDTHMYPKTAQTYSPDLLFGLVTNDTLGPRAANGPIQPKYINFPAWVVTFRNVPDEIGMLGPAPAPGTTPSPQPIRGQRDILITFDAATGSFLFSIERPSVLPGRS
jgi:hypothetical protein